MNPKKEAFTDRRYPIADHVPSNRTPDWRAAAVVNSLELVTLRFLQELWS
ncbi:MAG: hypothetical protein ACM37Z_18720 [Deltaproteobacteria bacterium]